MSVRLALGKAISGLRQVLTESLLLSCAGGALGLLLGYSGRTLLPNLVAAAWQFRNENTPSTGRYSHHHGNRDKSHRVFSVPGLGRVTRAGNRLCAQAS